MPTSSPANGATQASPKDAELSVAPFEPIEQLRAHEYVAEQIRRQIGLHVVSVGGALPSERELSAMSAETRLSAWILALLPVGIGGFLILTNPRYFGAMWFDPSGRQLVYVAFGLQLIGAWLLYRLTRLRGA